MGQDDKLRTGYSRATYRADARHERRGKTHFIARRVIDLYPTLAELAGLPLTNNSKAIASHRF